MTDLQRDDLLPALRRTFAQWAELDDEQWALLAALFHGRTVAARDYVAQPGATEHELIFVGQGLLRYFYSSAEGKESNKAFVAEGELAGPLASALLGLPLAFGVQALEPTTMLVAPLAAFTQLYERDHVFERLGRRLAELLLVRKELRTRSLLEQRASERYQSFVRTHPTLVSRIPQYHLASYLGITEVSLSRLKRALLEQAEVSI